MGLRTKNGKVGKSWSRYCVLETACQKQVPVPSLETKETKKPRLSREKKNGRRPVWGGNGEIHWRMQGPFRTKIGGVGHSPTTNQTWAER